MRKPPIKDVIITEERPVEHRIAWWMENTTIRFIKRLFNAIKENIRELISFSLNDWIDDLEQGLLDIISPTLEYLDTIEGIPVWLRATLSRAQSGEHAAGVICVAAIAYAAFEILKVSLVEVIGRSITYGLNRVIRTVYPGYPEQISMAQRKQVEWSHYLSAMSALGYSNTVAEALYNTFTPQPDDATLLRSMWRKEINWGEVNDYLVKRGFTDKHRDMWWSSTEVIPSPSDIISISVREGFNEAVVAQFGYEEAYPAELKDFGEKQGLSEFWTRRLWYAHWRLPSPTQIYDMFHRDIIKEDVLDIYLKAADYPPYWRNKLKELAYSPVTRVDVRRMFALGVLDESEVFDRYLALGYDPLNAGKMTIWTIAEYAEKERDLTKSDILSMYQESLLTQNESTAYLLALGYKEVDISLLLARRDLARQATFEKELTKTIHDMYLSNIIDRASVYNELGTINPPSGFVENLLQLWDLEKLKRVKRPSNTDLKSMGKAGILTAGQIRHELEIKGYSNTYISYYLELWIGE